LFNLSLPSAIISLNQKAIDATNVINDK